MKCFECQKLGHYASECRSHVKCYECQKYGYYASDCRNKKKKEEANLVQAREDDEPTKLMSLCAGETSAMVMLNEKKSVSEIEEGRQRSGAINRLVSG